MSKQQQLLHALQDEYMTTAQVQFEGHAKCYTYKVRKGWDVKAGDTLVVKSPSTGLTCVRVVSVDAVAQLDDESSIKYTWAVQKVNTGMYEDMLAREDLFMRQIREVDALHKRETMLTKAREVLSSNTAAREAFELAVKGLE